MKQNALAILGVTTLLATSVGALHAAGRAVDNPMPLYKGTTADDTGGPSGALYTGRPNDNAQMARPRTDGDAEFAQMEVHGEADVERNAYHGRPMDNPHLAN